MKYAKPFACVSKAGQFRDQRSVSRRNLTTNRDFKSRYRSNHNKNVRNYYLKDALSKNPITNVLRRSARELQVDELS